MFRLRPFEAKDVSATVAIWNALNPDWPRSEEEVLDDYRKHDPKYNFQRYVAELDGQVAGFAQYDQSVSSYHPQKFLLELCVLPAFQGRGLGKAFYETILAAIQPYNPVSLRVQVRENSARALRFLAERGFSETKRDWVSVLEVASCDLGPYQGLETALVSQGITFTSLAELQKTDPEAIRKFYELFSEVRLDVPRAEPATPIAYDFFVKNVLEAPDFDGRAFLVATKGSEYIGFTGLYPVTHTQMLDQWLTGVKSAYRKRNIALALKVRSIQFAKDNGYVSIRTDNDSNNIGMLTINDKLGFKRGAANLSMLKVFGQ